jgi:YegS/Rv2252/BmrU family lipid kinase
VKIICNPSTYGGKARRNWPHVIKHLKEARLDFEIEWTKGPLDAIRITKESVDEHEIICAYGGDGTVNEIITGIGQTGFRNTLGIIPAGRGNDNAFNLRQTNKIEDIIEMLHKKETRTIDCITIDEGQRYCLGIAGAGIDAVVAAAVIGKDTRISYNISLIKSFFSYRPRHMHIDIDDGMTVLDQKCLTTMVCNGQRVGNKKMVAPDAIIDDGLLDILVIGNTGILESLITSRGLNDGTHLKNPKAKIYRGKKVTIDTNSEKEIPVHSMGEMLGPLPHDFECLPKKLKVLRMSDEILKREGWETANIFSANVTTQKEKE